jgi:endonuclease-3 related protein
MKYYEALRSRFGHRGWWPGDSPLEVCVGAVLTQNTSWKNVKQAIDNLKSASALDLIKLYRMSHDELAGIIRPAGYFNVKARRLRNVVNHIVECHGADLDSLFSSPIMSLREELLSINGVGPETADSIMLYAAEKPIFVVDAYTQRVLRRHRLTKARDDYSSVQKMFHDCLKPDTALYNDFHAQIVAVGHRYCKPNPICDDCPLQPFLNGPPV